MVHKCFIYYDCFHLSLNAYVLMHKCILSLVGSFGSYVVSMMVEF